MSSDSERPASLVDGQGSFGATRIRWTAAAVGAPLRIREGESVGVSSGKGQPNLRLKLTAPGLGRNCVCALASCGVSLHLDAADGDGRRSLAAPR